MIKKMIYEIHDGCEVWEPQKHESPWHEVIQDRLIYANNTYTPITKHQFKIYRMSSHLTLERSPDAFYRLRYEDHGDYVRIIGPMDTKDQEEFKAGTVFVVSDQTFSWALHYQFNEDIETPPQELLDLPNRTFQQVVQRILPDKDVQFSGLEYHNDVLIDGKKIVGTVIMSNGTGMYQHGLCTWEYDHELFKRLLPEAQLYRIAKQHGAGRGITGIKNELSDDLTTKYTRDDFLSDLLQQLKANIAKFEQSFPYIPKQEAPKGVNYGT